MTHTLTVQPFVVNSSKPQPPILIYLAAATVPLCVPLDTRRCAPHRESTEGCRRGTEVCALCGGRGQARRKENAHQEHGGGEGGQGERRCQPKMCVSRRVMHRVFFFYTFSSSFFSRCFAPPFSSGLYGTICFSVDFSGCEFQQSLFLSGLVLVLVLLCFMTPTMP